jgi:hypothetical protein
MSTRISGRHCKRAACCRRRDDAVERAANICAFRRQLPAPLRSERGIRGVVPAMKEVDRQSIVSLLEPEAARGGPTDNRAMSAVVCELADRTQFTGS